MMKSIYGIVANAATASTACIFAKCDPALEIPEAPSDWRYLFRDPGIIECPPRSSNRTPGTLHLSLASITYSGTMQHFRQGRETG